MATNKNAKNASNKQGKNDNTQKQAQKTEDKAANLVKEDKKTPQSTEKNDKKTKKKSSEKGKKPNIFQQMVGFFKGVYRELKKVTWLTKEELLQRTGIVAGVVAIFTLLTWIVDTGLGGLATLFLKK
ncbi:preprotein translocase subunit SecE [Acetobacterium paludosum]|uniref:Protein translocase subunit SecE n=1 Tax=Acetobacterium paludosum TaxID=52693 RepID=A0A923HRI1_9FIRM|nr:preprotein translocase subunit SecE [Acetobacterium paludosum]MBC3887056.1 preprotein translocase subunit SecE [Acetobacterium paludosum]